MNITFEDCSIKHDGMQYHLIVKSTPKKKDAAPANRTLGYYRDESQLLRGMINHGLSMGIETVEQIESMVNNALLKLER